MRVNYLVILIVIAALTGVYLYAQESRPPEEGVATEPISELLESMKGNWVMFQSGNSMTFLYNRNTGAVYRHYVRREGDNFPSGFERVPIVNRSDVEIPSAF